jgi:hypothetical protein
MMYGVTALNWAPEPTGFRKAMMKALPAEEFTKPLVVPATAFSAPVYAESKAALIIALQNVVGTATESGPGTAPVVKVNERHSILQRVMFANLKPKISNVTLTFAAPPVVYAGML